MQRFLLYSSFYFCQKKLQICQAAGWCLKEIHTGKNYAFLQFFKSSDPNFGIY